METTKTVVARNQLAKKIEISGTRRDRKGSTISDHSL